MSLLMCEQEGGTEEVGWCTQKVQAAYAAMGSAVERPRSVGTACQLGPVLSYSSCLPPMDLEQPNSPCMASISMFHFVATLGGHMHSKSLD